MYYLKVDPDSVDNMVREALLECLQNHKAIMGDRKKDKLTKALNRVIAYYSTPGGYEGGKYDDF